MGFKLPRRNAFIKFEDDFEGAEVRIKLDVTLEEFMFVQKLQADGNVEGVCEFVGALLIDWNLEDDDGNPLPANKEGARRATFAFIDRLLTEWVKAQTGVPGPLGAQSANGVKPPMAIPQEAL